MTRLAFVAGLLWTLCACEDNEHPFGDSWSVSCPVEGMPPATAFFQEPRRLDDSGGRREYLGFVTMDFDGVQDAYIWQVAVDLGENAAETVAFEHVPIPEAYLAPEGPFAPLRLDVVTFEEDAETTTATMTGTCTYDGVDADLEMGQRDDCDLCFTCNTTRTPPPGWLATAALLALTRRSRSRGASRATA